MPSECLKAPSPLFLGVSEADVLLRAGKYFSCGGALACVPSMSTVRLG